MGPTSTQRFRPPRPLAKSKAATKAATSTAVQAITKVRSVQALQGLLTTAIGSIVYLRNLFPSSDFENWDPSRIFPDDPRHPNAATTRPEPLFLPDSTPSQSSQATLPSSSQEGPRFTAMRISQSDNASANAKLLTNYLAGAMEALEKGYLSSLMFIIYLDENRPDDILEAYTFNFAYAKGSDVPTMSLDQLTLADGASQSQSAQRYVLGTPRSEQDVRTSVARMIKQCVIATQTLADLPEERVLDFKLFYNELAPEDYHPSFFHTGSENTLTLGTKSAEEVPIYKSVGGVQTGHHGMSVKIASVVQHCEYFMPLNEVLEKYEGEKPDDAKQEVFQRATMGRMLEDAEQRNILFDAEKLVADPSHGPLEPTAPADIESHRLAVPFGHRNADGSVQDIGANESMLPQTQATVLFGKRDERAGRIGRPRNFGGNACTSSQLDSTKYSATQPFPGSEILSLPRPGQTATDETPRMSPSPDNKETPTVVDLPMRAPSRSIPRTPTTSLSSRKLKVSPDTVSPQSKTAKKRKSSHDDDGRETSSESSDTTSSDEFDPKRERSMSALATPKARKPSYRASRTNTPRAKKIPGMMPPPQTVPKPKRKQARQKPAASSAQKAKQPKTKAVASHSPKKALGNRPLVSPSPPPPGTSDQAEYTQTQTLDSNDSQRTESVQQPWSQTLPQEPPSAQETFTRALKRTKTSLGIGTLITRTTIADWNTDQPE